MNAKDYESKRMKELRRYSRMMWFEECELARGRKYFQKFSLLKSYPIRESNNTADAIRNREKLLIPYHPIPYHPFS